MPISMSTMGPPTIQTGILTGSTCVVRGDRHCSDNYVVLPGGPVMAPGDSWHQATVIILDGTVMLLGDCRGVS